MSLPSLGLRHQLVTHHGLRIICADVHARRKASRKSVGLSLKNISPENNWEKDENRSTWEAVYWGRKKYGVFMLCGGKETIKKKTG